MIILFLLSKTQNYICSCSNFINKKTAKNSQKFLAEDLKDQFIGMNIKQSKSKNTTNEFRFFLESNFVRVNRLYNVSINENVLTKQLIQIQNNTKKLEN